MKILLQNQYDGALGGVETYFQLLVKALLEKGHEVVALYTMSGRKIAEQKENFKAFYLPDLDLTEDDYFAQKRNRQVVRDLRVLRLIAREEKPDIIHLNNTYYPAQFNPLRVYAPVLQTVHDFFNCCPTLLRMFPREVCNLPLGFNCFKKGCVSSKSIRELWRFKTKSINREAMKSYDRHLVTSEYMKAMLLRNGFEESKIEVVPLFVEDWGVRVREEPQEGVLIYVGRLAKEKGALHFIHMLKLINRDFKAYIIGEGPQREECENLVCLMGLKDKVTFTGFLSREELKQYFIKSSLVVVPSLWPEPFCLVGLEAMSAARPVVAYDVGGISTWLQDAYNGFLVPRANIEALARASNSILKDKKLALDLGENGRFLFGERFREETHFSRLFSIYESALEESKRKKEFLGARAFFMPQRARSKFSKRLTHTQKLYPKRSANESLPEYNKRIIAHEIEHKIIIVKSYPEEITISTTTRCNMDPPCVICERNLRPQEGERDLDKKVLQKLKPIFKYADRIYLHCGGEPLMTQRSFDIIESVKPPTRVIFNTNGVLFTNKTIHHMVECGVVDVISFSIDAATEATYKRIRSADFNRVINTIDTIIQYRNIKNKDKPLLRPLVLMNFCIFKQNMAEVPDYVSLAHRLGADGVDFSHLNQGFDWQQKREEYTFDYKNESVLSVDTIEEHDTLITKAYELSKQYSIPINFNGNPFISELNSNKEKIKNDISEIVRLKKRCSAPWSSAVVDADGRLRICCFHHNLRYTIGNLGSPWDKETHLYELQNKTFDEVWNGAETASIRKEFLDTGIAKRCKTDNLCIFQNRI